MASVLMAKAPHGLSIEQRQPPLRSFLCLDGWLFVHSDDTAYSADIRYSTKIPAAFVADSGLVLMHRLRRP